MKTKMLTVDVSLKDTDGFKQLVALLKEISMREDVSQDIKDKIDRYANEFKKPGDRKIITCQNCGALLVDFNGNYSHIHLGNESISLGEKNLLTLNCRCGCTLQYKD